MISYKTTRIEGVRVAFSNTISDERGGFSRLFCADVLADVVADKSIVQINLSRNHHPGTIRGLHFQSPPAAEMKFVRCLRGEVFDVVVDLRAGSQTFLHYHSEVLNAENGAMMIVPEGCAHGFQTLAPDTELVYLHTQFYQLEHEGGLCFDDPAIDIKWPMSCTLVSEKDRRYKKIDSSFRGISL